MKTTLKEALKSAMRAKDKVATETIRALLSEIQYEELQTGKTDLDPASCLTICQREVKKRKEAISFEEQANRVEEKEKLENEIKVLEQFLPQMLSEEKLEEILQGFKASAQNASMGLAMKHLKDSYQGQYDGKVASQLAKRIFG
jgi:uncharacterized protein YqeY